MSPTPSLLPTYSKLLSFCSNFESILKLVVVKKSQELYLLMKTWGLSIVCSMKFIRDSFSNVCFLT